ncbi:MAG TPA: S41 family peptidase [Kiloniellales bacterium]|jgi:carboxyl-terminal processing protease|nr:S41 family peptidase [Kiloniellales bacterium]
MQILRKTTAAASLLLILLLAPLPLQAQEADTYRHLKLFGEVFERVRADFVEEVTDEELIAAAIRGMLTDLDPHSGYLDPDSFREMRTQTRGEFGGLGIEVTMENGLVKVVSPIDDTPAFRAGVQAGDFITHIDNEPVMGLTLSEAVDLMRGPVDSTITVTIRRGEEEPFDLEIIRDIIRVQSVRHRTEGNIGYLRITSFTEQTTPGLEEAIAEIEEELGDKLEGFVLDLRNNPGGLLDEAISVTDLFLDRGEIVSTRGRHDEDSQRWNATDGDRTNGLPIVVLINGGSASASEIVAGALQDHRRAIVMGVPSFGKGSVQTVIPLGAEGAMRLTTARYYTPSGRSIQAKGIEPDILVEQATVTTAEQQRQRREADLRRHLEGEGEQSVIEPTDPVEETPEDEEEGQEGETPVSDSTAGPEEGAMTDYQLARALDLLRGLALFSQNTVN